MAFYYGTRLDALGRRRLFGSINSGPSLYEAVMSGLPPATAAGQNGFDLRTRPGAQAVRPLRTLSAQCPSTSGGLVDPQTRRTVGRLSPCPPWFQQHARLRAAVPLPCLSAAKLYRVSAFDRGRRNLIAAVHHHPCQELARTRG